VINHAYNPPSFALFGIAIVCFWVFSALIVFVVFINEENVALSFIKKGSKYFGKAMPMQQPESKASEV